MGYNEDKLTAEELLILNLIRRKYDYAKEIIADSEIDHTAFISLLQRHRISIAIYKRILEHMPGAFTKEYVTAFKIGILQQINYNKKRRDELRTLAILLDKSGYPPMTIKGFVYEDMTDCPRMFSDIDLLIKEKDLGEIIHVLDKNGYRYNGPAGVLSLRERTDISGQTIWNNQYPYKCPNMDFNFEIHTNLFERDRIRYENLEDLLDNIDLFWNNKAWSKKDNCYLPCYEASLVLLCLHISLKRSLASKRNYYLLRHVIDMDAILNQKINIGDFLFLCEIWNVSYHAFFALKLHEEITDANLSEYTGPLSLSLARSEKRLARIHISCLKNLTGSNKKYVFLYNLFMPFAIGGGISKSIRWYLNVIFPTRVEQEHIYSKYGFIKESWLIYLTYLVNPLRLLYNKITTKKK